MSPLQAWGLAWKKCSKALFKGLCPCPLDAVFPEGRGSSRTWNQIRVMAKRLGDTWPPGTGKGSPDQRPGLQVHRCYVRWMDGQTDGWGDRMGRWQIIDNRQVTDDGEIERQMTYR